MADSQSPEISEEKSEYFAKISKVAGPENYSNTNPPQSTPPIGGTDSDRPRPLKSGGRTNTNSSWKSFTSSLGKLRRVSSPLFASPWEHDSPTQGEWTHHHTVKEFDHNLQRKRLFTNSLSQWFVTVVLCLALVGTLKGFSTYNWLSKNQRHGFNALVTGFSLALGINLASALRGYASMMRWRFLASTYRPLHEFELVMQCESQTKVMSLFWSARTKGRFWPNATQMLCAGWILLNVLVQVLIALLGLTYSIDSSTTFVTTSQGNISIADLSFIRDRFNKDATDILDELGAAQEYGVQGESFGVYQNIPQDQQTYKNGIYTDSSWSYFLYRFVDDNAQNSQVNIVSSRTINATATCKAFVVTQVGIDDWPNITYVDSNGHDTNFYIGDFATGAVTYLGNTASNCGSRCAEVWALQVADNLTVKSTTLFKCTNILGKVVDDDTGVTTGVYQMPDAQAQIIAGSIGWSGIETEGDSFQYQLYSTVTPWSPNYTMSINDTAQLIADFSIGAIAAMDDHGLRVNVSSPEDPSTAQIVSVQWNYAAALLAIVPFLHFLGLLGVIHWAGRVIIKDDSYLAAARLLRPVVDELGPHGCLLTGEQIAEELDNIKVSYGYREPTASQEGGDIVRHLDVIQEAENLGPQRSMPLGRYDGEASQETTVRRRRTRRMSA